MFPNIDFDRANLQNLKINLKLTLTFVKELLSVQYFKTTNWW